MLLLYFSFCCSSTNKASKVCQEVKKNVFAFYSDQIRIVIMFPGLVSGNFSGGFEGSITLRLRLMYDEVH